MAKSSQGNPQRYNVNDCVAAGIGALLSAPVPPVTLLSVDQGLFGKDPELSHFRFGVVYATAQMPNLTNRMQFEYSQDPCNRDRFARLALLYGWINVHSDQQLMYLKHDPRMVFSMDHEESIANCGRWVDASLGTVPAATPDNWIMTGSGLAIGDLKFLKPELAAVTDAQIAEVVAVPPNTWGISVQERVCLGKWLVARRDEMIAAL